MRLHPLSEIIERAIGKADIAALAAIDAIEIVHCPLLQPPTMHELQRRLAQTPQEAKGSAGEAPYPEIGRAHV